MGVVLTAAPAPPTPARGPALRVSPPARPGRRHAVAPPPCSLASVLLSLRSGAVAVQAGPTDGGMLPGGSAAVPRALGSAQRHA